MLIDLIGTPTGTGRPARVQWLSAGGGYYPASWLPGTRAIAQKSRTGDRVPHRGLGEWVRILVDLSPLRYRSTVCWAVVCVCCSAGGVCGGAQTRQTPEQRARTHAATGSYTVPGTKRGVRRRSDARCEIREAQSEAQSGPSSPSASCTATQSGCSVVQCRKNSMHTSAHVLLVS